MSRLFLVALVAAVGSSASAAGSPPYLDHVPAGAAVFAHASVAKLWAGPVGEQLRAAKIKEVERAVAEFEAITGLTPADVTAATVYFPDLRTPGGSPVEQFGVSLALAKPIDAGRLVAAAAVGCLASEDKVTYTYAKNVLTLLIPDRARRPQGLREEIVLDMTDSRNPKLFVAIPAAARKPVKLDTGRLESALSAAQSRDFVVGINYDMLPPELRSDEAAGQPAVRPFLPLLKSDLALIVGDFTADTFAIEARFRSGNAAVVRDCEKSLGALQTLLGTLLDAGLKSAARSKVPAEKLLAPVGESLKRSIDAAAIRIDGRDAVATLAIRADLPFGPALAAAFGKTVGGARDRTMSQNNLKQLGLALHSYSDANATMPAPAVVGKKGKPLLSWRVSVLPYVEQGALFSQFKLDEAWDSAHNLKLLKDNPMPAVYALPGVTKPGDKETHYRVFVGNGAAFEPLKALRFPTEFPDGTSNTLLVATAATAVPWTKPEELAFDPKADMKKLLRMDNDGCNVTFADGSVRFLRSTVGEANLNAMITRAGGEVIDFE